jgi:hypothetical protein
MRGGGKNVFHVLLVGEERHSQRTGILKLGIIWEGSGRVWMESYCLED